VNRTTFISSTQLAYYVRDVRTVQTLVGCIHRPLMDSKRRRSSLADNRSE